MIASILEADTLTDALTLSAGWAAKDNLGHVYVFQSARFADSDLPGALPFYAIADVVDSETGEQGRVTVGGDSVVAALFRCAERGEFPFSAKVEAVDLGNSKTAFNLVLAPTKVKNTTTR